MSQYYYVNRNAQWDSKDHEVHIRDCKEFPEEENAIALGLCDDCHEAVRKARQYFKKCNGCYYCTEECHTS